MNNNQKSYIEAFKNSLGVDEKIINKSLEYNSIPEWDSIAHMTLIADLEEKFSISIDTDDIVDFSSFEKGKEILLKYKIKI